MATGKWHNYRWVPYWRLCVTCFSNTLSHLCCWLCSTMSEEGHYWELLQAQDDVQGWLVCQAPTLLFLCSQHWDEVSFTASWKGLHSRASTHCTVVHSGPRRHGWSEEAFLNRIQHSITVIDTRGLQTGPPWKSRHILICQSHSNPPNWSFTHPRSAYCAEPHPLFISSKLFMTYILFTSFLVVSHTPSFPAIEVSFSHSSLSYMCFFILLWLLKWFSLLLLLLWRYFPTKQWITLFRTLPQQH